MSFTIQPPLIIERVTRVAAIGIRFVDPVAGRFISELEVAAVPAVAPNTPPRPLLPNRSAVYVLHHDVTPGTYVLTVGDPLGRFLPVALQVDVPTHGLYIFTPGSPPEVPLAGVPLFSTPHRPALEGMAVVRADMFDPIASQPAANAILEVRRFGQLLGRGMADYRGQVAVILPYPPPTGSLVASPPARLSPPQTSALFDQTWGVEIDVAYAPWLTTLTASGAVDLDGAFAQLHRPLASVWADPSQTRRLSTTTLRFGQDLILRSSTTPRLLVTPAGSPP